MESLAVKYRPHKFEDVCSQNSIIKILEKQVELRQFTNCYLFAGPSGCGKTTLARIFANEINKGEGKPIELDSTSMNIDDVRRLSEEAKARAIDCEYKVYIIDECHRLGGDRKDCWNALLKTIEEPPKYTIFMFCTTEPEKIIPTIQNRVMKFNLTKVDTTLIKNRLTLICNKEGYVNYEETVDYISKLASGGMRDAISMLEKCAQYSNDLNITNALECLGNFDPNTFFDLTGAFLNGEEQFVLETIEGYYKAGKDLKTFVNSYLNFVLDLTKYCLFNNIDATEIPYSLRNRCEGCASIPDIVDYLNKLVDAMLDIKFAIKDDVNNKTTIEAMAIKVCRGL